MINSKPYVTAYPPVSQILFRISFALFGGNVLAMKAVFSLFEFLALLVAWKTADSVGKERSTADPDGLESVLYFRIFALGSFRQRHDVPDPAFRLSARPRAEKLGDGQLCGGRSCQTASRALVPAVSQAHRLETHDRGDRGRTRVDACVFRSRFIVALCEIARALFPPV